MNYLLDGELVEVKILVKPDKTGNPVVLSDKEYRVLSDEERSSVREEKAKFLRPGWGLFNFVFGSGDRENQVHEKIVRYLLKEWSLPLKLELREGVRYEELSNYDEVVGEKGVVPLLLYEFIIGYVRKLGVE